MGYGNCGTDSKGRPIGYANDAQCDTINCSKIIDRGMSYACGGEHGETEYSCEGYFCEEHKHQPILDDDHLFYQYNVGSLCDDCADTIELDEKEDKIKLDPELLQCGEFDRPLFGKLTDLQISVDDGQSYKALAKDVFKQTDNPTPKLYKHQRDAIRHMMETPPVLLMDYGMGATNTSLGKTLPSGGEIRGSISGRWSASDVAAARNKPKVLDEALASEKPAKTSVVRGDITVTFTDKSLYEAVKDGQEKLNRQLAEMVSEAVVEYNRKMMKNLLGRTQYTDEIQKLEIKKKYSGLNAVETGTLTHLKIMDRTEQLGVAYGKARTIDVQKALEAETKLHPSKHLRRPCPPKYHFKFPEFKPNELGQAEDRMHRVGKGKPKVFEMDLADIEKRVLAHMSEKQRKKWLEGDWNPQPGPQAEAMGLNDTKAAHLSFKPEDLYQDKLSSEDDGQLDIGKDEKGRVYYVGTSVPEGMEMDYNFGIETMGPSDAPSWGAHGSDAPDMKAMSHHEPPKKKITGRIDPDTLAPVSGSMREHAPGAMSVYDEAGEVTKDAWDRLGGAPKKPAELDTWDMAMKKPK